MSVMGDHSDADDNGDGEGVWSPDIEKCFREALLLFPPCGRRKHILQEEGGKMYGRNELIARHIRMRTGKIRSRKQVSSHIQVLARRKAKAESSNGLSGSSAELSTASSSPANLSQVNNSLALNDTRNQLLAPVNSFSDLWTDRPIVTSKIRLLEFSAFIEQRRLAPHLNDSSRQIGAPTDELIFGANLNHTQQMNSDLLGQPNGGLLMPVYESTNQLGAPMPTAATNLSQRHLASPHHLNLASSLQGSNTPAMNSYPSQLQQQPSLSQQLQQPLNNNHHHHQQLNQRNTEANNMMITAGAHNLINNHHLHPGPISSGFTRHSYIKIDYRTPIHRQTNKLEPIDIDQLQDKFPEIGGSEGLYRRGPPDAFYLVKFWADINSDFEYNIDDQNSFFGFSCHFETIEPFRSITCSTKACSYGSQVVEKVEKIYAAFNSSNGRYTYKIDRSPMCEFMTQFIEKLRQLPDLTLMNRILENFTVLQLVTSETDILLCIAYVFEIGLSQRGSHHHVYKLTKIHDS